MNIKYVCILMINLSVGLFAENRLLINNSIVDIGRTGSISEIEVPKQRVETEPNIKNVANKIIYDPRSQHEKKDCATDQLGTEGCPISESVCDNLEELDDGNSTKHTVIKSFEKFCPYGTVKDGDKCYLDADYDGVKDFLNKIATVEVLFSVNLRGYNGAYDEFASTLPLDDFNPLTHVQGQTIYNFSGCSDYGASKIVSKEIIVKPYNSVSVSHIDPHACDDDKQVYKVYVDGELKISRNCSDDIKDTGYIELLDNKSNQDKNFSVVFGDIHFGSGWDDPVERIKTVTIDGNIVPNYIIEENIDKIYFYKNAVCPTNTTEQADGKCKMEYNWYSYSCPSDINSYENRWKIKDSGANCGNPTCTNSSTPPKDNCVRVDFTCPVDSSIQCVKTNKDGAVCQEGFVEKNNRCERIIPYCGDLYYNPALDVCEDISTYVKLCANSEEVYNTVTNKCESESKACVNGTYDKTLNRCVMDFVPTCPSGYSYNRAGDYCEDLNLKVCPDGYVYDATGDENGGATCKSTIKICDFGYTFNAQTSSCEKDRCGILETMDLNGRCETKPMCEGTLLPNGNCIPTKIK